MSSSPTGPGRTAARLRGIAAVALTLGVVCQFVQRTDPTPSLLYFTVDSAILAATVMIWRLVRGPAGTVWGDRVRGAAVVGVVFSSLVYVTVIAPSSPSGTWFGAHDDAWARTATLFLHGAAPVLVIAEFLLSPYSLPATWREATLLAWWPTTYLAVVGTLSWSGAATMPYLFLRPSRFGAVAVAAAVAVLYAIVVALGVALAATHHAVRRHHHTVGTR
ncbi:Pr6Pr family membrane protein [Streptomyces sp. NBC_00989]|uniref:Pr6Pr family membrane protein n=1 Tax=Streptomyces sp. NBC_00989 TaxID=2903705 RepID=UPI0038641660|nr:Pr6Pr family membrane protein [Streptomyces sp. NBC_00989]